MVAITAPSSIEQIPLMRCPRANAVQQAGAAVPCVDLSAPGAGAAVADACRSVGFFRATNHGVPARVADALEARAMAFFALPAQEKLDMSGAARPLGYGSKSIGANGDVGWLEYHLLSVSANTVKISSLPPSLRYVSCCCCLVFAVAHSASAGMNDMNDAGRHWRSTRRR